MHTARDARASWRRRGRLPQVLDGTEQQGNGRFEIIRDTKASALVDTVLVRADREGLSRSALERTQ